MIGSVASPKTMKRQLAACLSPPYNSSRCQRPVHTGPKLSRSDAAEAAQATFARKSPMPKLYDNPDQEALHLKAIKALAIETGREFALVKQIYETELAQLQTGARIREYVVLLSSRRTRETLRQSSHQAQSQFIAA
jgi:hypothetical protein